jgi:two-component system, OmpR family, KDP operon response regulator KdpE
VDLERRLARHQDGHQVRLTPIEHRILESFARYPDRIINQNHLIREVWGPEMADARSVRVYIASLRRKLERDPRLPRHIITEYGVGYRLVAETISETNSMPDFANWLRSA